MSLKVLGESEPVVRLPAFAFALAAPQAIFWGLRGRWGRGAEPVDPPGGRRARAAVFACLWSGVLCTILFGLPMPQTITYIRHAARTEHRPLGLRLIADVAEYLTNYHTLPLALAVLVISGAGWYLVRRDRALILAFLTPGLAWALYLVAPGTRSLPRLSCFVIVPVMMGLALAGESLARRGLFPRVLLACFAVAWLANLAVVHRGYIAPDFPDLKGLAADLSKSKVLLFYQAEANHYYFRNADRLESVIPDHRRFARYDYIVQGILRARPNPDLDALGYTCVRSIARGRT